MNDLVKLMLVEDERIVALDLSSQLKALGYDVHAVVSSGEQAVRRAADDVPDLILMDIHLDGAMDGIDAAQEIQRRLHIPVVFLTAYAEDETLRRALGSRPFGYLVKPCEGRELHATIQMALARRAVEIAVEQSETRLHLALDAAELGVLEWSLEADRLHATGHLGVLYDGRPMPVEETCSEFLARVHPADKTKVEAAIHSTLQKNETVDLIFRANAEDGTLHYIEAHAKAYPGIDGSTPRVIGILKDVTERYLKEESLMLSRVVFDTTAEALVITDAVRNIVAVNAAFAKITGYPQAEAQGRNLDELLRIRGSGEGLLHQLTVRDQDFWQGEAFCQRKNGESFPSWQSLSAVRNDLGETTHFVTAFSDISPILAAEQQLDHLAHHDPLTGLPNRLLFDDRFGHALIQAERQQQKCLLLFIDLDDFKVVNDTLGHTTGDKLLQVVSSRLSVVLRRSDTIARLGGDEFVVIAEATDSEDGTRLAEKILDTLGHPVTLGRERLTISCSIGISVYPDHGRDRHTLMRAADIAMYSAKSHGRNRYQLYSEAMASRASERLKMEQGLRQAIQADALTLHYQPQIGLADGSLCGIEALVRWPHPELGMIPPARFIPVAEESGVIDLLGRWVLRRACREMRGIQGADGRQLRLAVNVSARQFLRDDFFESIRAILAETDFPPQFLELEITESCLQDIGRSAALLTRLKALEVSISIDDFGTGYSSLSVLRGLPIDRLKVDRSFIADLHQQADSVNVVHAICTLAKSLGMTIVAEGIELEEQFLIMRGLGCEEGQGFLFSHAVPHSELLDLLQKTGASFRLP